MKLKWHLNHKRHGKEPWAVQAEALRRSNGAAKYGYWLEQGLGKTSLALNEFIDQDDTDINVVVAPSSFVGDWTLAPEEWGVGWLPTGQWENGDPVPLKEEVALYALNVENARQYAHREMLELFEKRRVMFTVDESLIVKNPESQTFKKLNELAKRAKVVRELNGTPITQNVMDYYGQLRLLGRLDGMKSTVFRNRYCERGGFKGKQIVGSKNEDELARIIDECSFRALKKDWRKDLPPKIYIPVHLEMSPIQRRHYQSMMEEFFTMVGDDEVTAELVLTQMNKLRQISSCVLMDKGRHWFIEEDENNPKLRATFDIIDTSPGKTIISHYYDPSGKLLMDACRRHKLNPAFIKGRMKPADIIEQKRMFNDDPSCRVIICQQTASARGHTLLGQAGRDRCSTMVFYENDFSYYFRSQMEDRNNRGEQDTDCNVFDLITSPMDQITVDALVDKKDLANKMDDIIKAVRGGR